MHPEKQLFAQGSTRLWGMLRGSALRIEGLGIPSWGLLAWFLAVISVREGIEQVLFEKMSISCD